MIEDSYYNKGLRAKQLVGIYRNPYRQGSYEYDQWRLGFDHGIQEPLNNNIELEGDCDFINQFEPLYTINDD